MNSKSPKRESIQELPSSDEEDRSDKRREGLGEREEKREGDAQSQSMEKATKGDKQLQFTALRKQQTTFLPDGNDKGPRSPMPKGRLQNAELIEPREGEPTVVDRTPIDYQKEFLDKESENAIDESMVMYISVTRVKHLITEILEPVLVKAKQESDYARKVNIKMDDITKEFTEAKDKIEMLQRQVAAIEDLNKTVSKLSNDTVNFQQSMESQLRSNKMIIDNHKHEIQRVVREHEADTYKVERVNQVATKVENQFQTVQLQMMEMLGMHAEEYRQKTDGMQQTLTEVDMKVNHLEHASDHLDKDLKEASELLTKLNQQAQEDKEAVQKLAEQVVDCSTFRKRQKYFERALEHYEKRLKLDEENTGNFGQFIVRFLPMTYMVNLAEHMSHCGHSRGLKNLKKFLDLRADTDVKHVKNHKYNFVADIETYKEKLLQKFTDVKKQVEQSIAPMEAAENQELEKRAKVLESKVEKRMILLEQIVKDFETEVKKQQNEAKLRLEKLQTDLDTGITSALQKAKNKKKEKLMNQLRQKSPTKENEPGSPESHLVEASPSPKKGKGEKKKKKNETPSIQVVKAEKLESEQTPNQIGDTEQSGKKETLLSTDKLMPQESPSVPPEKDRLSQVKETSHEAGSEKSRHGRDKPKLGKKQQKKENEVALVEKRKSSEASEKQGTTSSKQKVPKLKQDSSKKAKEASEKSKSQDKLIQKEQMPEAAQPRADDKSSKQKRAGVKIEKAASKSNIDNVEIEIKHGVDQQEKPPADEGVEAAKEEEPKAQQAEDDFALKEHSSYRLQETREALAHKVASEEITPAPEVQEQERQSPVQAKSTQHFPTPREERPAQEKSDRRVQILIPSEAAPSQHPFSQGAPNSKPINTTPNPLVPIIKIPSKNSVLNIAGLSSADQKSIGQAMQEPDLEAAKVRNDDVDVPGTKSGASLQKAGQKQPIEVTDFKAAEEADAEDARTLKKKASSRSKTGRQSGRRSGRTEGEDGTEEYDDEEEEEEEEEESGGSGKDNNQPAAAAVRAEADEQDEEEEEQEAEEEEEGGAEEEDDEEEDRDDEDEDSSSSLGIDLSNYYTKEEADKILKEQIAQLGTTLRNESKNLQATVEEQVKKADQLEKKIRDLAAETQKTLGERLSSMTQDLENMLKSQQREKSDLQTMNQKLIDRIEVLTKKVDDVNESIESICTITLCLLESQCMQLRSEEQDDQDKVNIALMGQKEAGAPKQEDLHYADKSEQFPMMQGERMKNAHFQDSLFQTTDRSPQGGPGRTFDFGGGGPATAGNQSPNIDPRISLQALEKQGFPMPVGHQPAKSHFGVKFVDHGNDLPDAAIKLRDSLPKQRKTLEIDPVCLSCTTMQGDIIKKFKIACLAYAPSPVVFRNIQFTRAQILVFRKFLMGQCNKIVLMKEPYSSLGMSTKRIFDDMYLFLKEANLKNTMENAAAGNPVSPIDEMNGMPANSYLEITSQYWNLIYKNSLSNNDLDEARQGGKRAPTLTVSGIEFEFNKSQSGMTMDHSTNPRARKRREQNNIGGKNYTQRGPQSRLESSMKQQKALDGYSGLGSRARDSIDSMSIAKAVKAGEHNARYGSAGVAESLDDVSPLIQGTHIDPRVSMFRPANSIQSKYASKTLQNATPKTAQSQLGKPRLKVKDKIQIDQNQISHSARKQSIEDHQGGALGVDARMKHNIVAKVTQVRATAHPVTASSLHPMMQYPMQGRQTALGARDSGLNDSLVNPKKLPPLTSSPRNSAGPGADGPKHQLAHPDALNPPPSGNSAVRRSVPVSTAAQRRAMTRSVNY